MESIHALGLRPSVNDRGKSALSRLSLRIIGSPSAFFWSSLGVSHALPSRGVFSAILTLGTGRLEQASASITSWFHRHGLRTGLHVLVTIGNGHFCLLGPPRPERLER
jgi:hypothetical protein